MPAPPGHAPSQPPSLPLAPDFVVVFNTTKGLMVMDVHRCVSLSAACANVLVCVHVNRSERQWKLQGESEDVGLFYYSMDKRGHTKSKLPRKWQTK